jgi:hypothetical protein
MARHPDAPIRSDAGTVHLPGGAPRSVTATDRARHRRMIRAGHNPTRSGRDAAPGEAARLTEPGIGRTVE